MNDGKTSGKSAFRRIFSFLRSAAIIAIVTFALLEVAVRVLGLADHLYTEAAFEAAGQDSYWVLKSNYQGRLKGPTWTETGPFGNRLHTPYAATIDPTAPRTTIAVFGDSVTFGQSIAAEEGFPAQLEYALGDAGHNIAVLNFGVPGHSLPMEVAHLQDRLPEIDADIVLLAFISHDLNPERANNRVDRFGYLTKTTFGPPSWAMDVFRAGLRKSHLAIVGKETHLRRFRYVGARAQVGRAPEVSDDDPRLQTFRQTIAKFRDIVGDRPHLVACLDLSASPMTQTLAQIMRAEFPELAFIEVHPAGDRASEQSLRVPKDGHPNAQAHQMMTTGLLPTVEALVNQATAMAGGLSAQ